MGDLLKRDPCADPGEVPHHVDSQLYKSNGALTRERARGPLPEVSLQGEDPRRDLERVELSEYHLRQELSLDGRGPAGPAERAPGSA